jgi:non-homologous end joining protein Ku
MSTDDGEQVRPFAATLQEIGRGSVHDRLSEQLQQLVAAVTETGKKGTLTLQLTVAPVKPGNVHNLLVTAKTALKAPEGDEAGNLSREDPTQLKLPLRGVETKKGASA